MPDAAPPDAVNPDDLMRGVRRGSFLAILLISIVVHLVLIFGTSIGYMRLMRQYQSWHPRFEMKRVAKQKREEDSEAKRKAAYEKFLADQTKTKAKDKAAPDKGAPEPKEDTGKGEVPKALKAKSGERPKDSSLKMNELDSP
jgi:hypothetical protein